MKPLAQCLARGECSPLPHSNTRRWSPLCRQGKCSHRTKVRKDEVTEMGFEPRSL